jgi:hypothetical protein
MNCRYTFQPDCSPYLLQKDCIALKADWFFTVDTLNIWLPVGYFYDGASIPRIFWEIIGSPFEPDFWAAALAHDWIYLTHCLPRATADEIFRQFLIMAGVSSWRARIMWAAVRTGGYFAWKNRVTDVEELARMKSGINARPDGSKFNLGDG